MNALQQLADLASAYWAFECFEFPFNAISAGYDDGSTVLFREAPEDYERRYRESGVMLRQLDAIDPEGLPIQEQATHVLLRHELSALRSQFEVGAHLRPWLFVLGPEFYTTCYASAISITSQAEAILYTERLRNFPAYFAQISANLLAGKAKGMRYPAAVLRAAIGNVASLLSTAPEQTPWFGPFKRSPIAARQDIAALAVEARGIIADELLPALQKYFDHLNFLLDHGAQESLSCAHGPAGIQFYETFVRYFTTLDITAAEVHQLGLAEVSRIAAEIEKISADAGYPGDVAGYRAFLTTDKQFIATSQDDLRQTLESLCKRVDKLIPIYFGSYPRATYGVDIMPLATSASMPIGYAIPSPAGGGAPGMFWVNGNLERCPTYIHVPLTVHEAWPGHLMHIALMHELTDLPEFRRHGAMKYPAYLEGWALYCERLALEMGLYQTTHQHFGRLEMELWRAVRLVVETGIHLYDWPREMAIAYMRDYLTFDLKTIESEVDRYAAVPGQALAYQIGALKIWQLRRHAESELGDRFNIKGFHDAVLTTGAVTLPVLEVLVKDWISGVMDHKVASALLNAAK